MPWCKIPVWCLLGAFLSTAWCLRAEFWTHPPTETPLNGDFFFSFYNCALALSYSRGISLLSVRGFETGDSLRRRNFTFQRRKRLPVFNVWNVYLLSLTRTERQKNTQATVSVRTVWTIQQTGGLNFLFSDLEKLVS